MAEVYIRVDKDTRVVTFVHRRPFDPINGLGETRENLLKTGFFVNEYPEPETSIGKRATAYYDHERKKVYYEYEVVPFTEKKRVEILEDALNDLLMSGDIFSNTASPRAAMLFSVAQDEDQVDGGGNIKMDGLAKYLASQIYQGKLDKEMAVNSYPEISDDIEKYLLDYDVIPIINTEE